MKRSPSANEPDKGPKSSDARKSRTDHRRRSRRP